MNNRLHNQPPPLRDHVANLPPGLEQVILKALARDPEERYASVAELAADLKNPEEVPRGRAPARRERRFTRLWPLLAGVPAAVFALLWYTSPCISKIRIAGSRAGGRAE